MIVSESVPLSSLTTFKIGGAARFVIGCATDQDALDAIAFAKGKGLPWQLLGQGSNVLAADEGYEGVIIRLVSEHMALVPEGIIADAGVSWDALVHEAATHSLWGIENLAGIPGTVGAAPVQNIGAYGSELKDTFLWAEVLDPATGAIERMDAAACAFGYRDSCFKREPGRIILRVAFALSAAGTPNLSYKDLARLIDAGEVLDTPRAVGSAVRRIRSGKFPDLAHWGTAGSFFKNPVIADETYAALKETYPELPGFAAPGGTKIALAWILDHALSLRDFRMGRVRLFEKQPLVIVADPGASAHEVVALAEEVVARVKHATNIAPEWEVRRFPK